MFHQCTALPLCKSGEPVHWSFFLGIFKSVCARKDLCNENLPRFDLHLCKIEFVLGGGGKINFYSQTNQPLSSPPSLLLCSAKQSSLDGRSPPPHQNPVMRHWICFPEAREDLKSPDWTWPHSSSTWKTFTILTHSTDILLSSRMLCLEKSYVHKDFYLTNVLKQLITLDSKCLLWTSTLIQNMNSAYFVCPANVNMYFF